MTMFIDRERAAAELARVCRPGGQVLATEFCWRRPPTEQAGQIFLGEVCPGLRFDTLEDWVRLYAGAGLGDVRTTTGAFDMMTARGFLTDEGWGTAAVSPEPCRGPPTYAKWPGSCPACCAPCPTSATSSSTPASPCMGDAAGPPPSGGGSAGLPVETVEARS